MIALLKTIIIVGQIEVGRIVLVLTAGYKNYNNIQVSESGFKPKGKIGMPSPELSIIIPAYQEEKRIGATISSLSTYLEKKHPGAEIIVVCDGCTDSTAEEASKSFKSELCKLTIVELEKNCGKGYAIKCGVEKANGQFIIFTDADLSFAPDTLESFLPKLLGGTDIVIAQRKKNVSYNSLIRRIFAIFSRFLVGNFLLPGIRDSQAGFKGFKNSVAKDLFDRMRTKRFLFDLEILVLARKKNYSIEKVYVDWQDKAGSTIHPILDLARSIRDLFVMFFIPSPISNSIKFDRKAALNCLRLILICIIAWHYSTNISSLFTYFEKSVQPRAKMSFLFAEPGSSSGECYARDFLVFYSGGLLNKERLEQHLHTDVYNPFIYTQTMERVIAPMIPAGLYALQYPPMIFGLITPLAFVDLYTAWRIWFFILAICVVITYVFTAYHALKARPLLLGGLLIALTSFPVTENFFLGQSTPIEAAIIALSFRLLIDKKYFWAGLFAGGSLLKLQYSPIILLPGFFAGKKKFGQGLFIMICAEALLSFLIVGQENILNFIKINYLTEVTHSINDSDPWLSYNFTGAMHCLPWFISTARQIGQVAYVNIAIILLWLWSMIYPRLKALTNQAIELVASLSITLLVPFSLHGCWYDYLLFVFPCLWLYIWSTTNEAPYSFRQSVARFIISVVVVLVPFLFWDSLVMRFSENTITFYQLRYLLISFLLIICAITALYLEFKTKKLIPNDKSTGSV